MESFIIIIITAISLTYLSRLLLYKYNAARAVIKSSHKRDDLRCLGCQNCSGKKNN